MVVLTYVIHNPDRLGPDLADDPNYSQAFLRFVLPGWAYRSCEYVLLMKSLSSKG